MKQTIEAKQQELQNVFSDSYVFEIPGYQRPYSWTDEQTEELLDDLIIAMGDSDSMDEISPYFLGSIVLIKDPTRPSAEVVDGQQRLTTLTLLFCALRELAEDDAWRQDIDSYVRAIGSESRGIKEQFRLTLRERDRKFFRENIQATGQLKGFLKQQQPSLRDAQRHVFENAEYLWKELLEMPQTKRNRLIKFLTQRCYLVVVSASDRNSAHRIFSVMNNRGLDLSPTDILKTDIVHAMPECVLTRYEEIEADLGREGFKDLFAHIRMIYVKRKQHGTLDKDFRDEVLSKDTGQKFIDKVLTPFAESYKIVSRAAYESTRDAEKINIYLRYLSRIDHDNWMPPAILFFHINRNDEAALTRFTRDLERLAYALFILRANGNERIKRYANLLHAIEKGDDLSADTGPLQLTTDERTDVLAALDGSIYLQVQVRMPLLLRLDSFLADHGATYDRKVISIEHVLPQTPAPESIWLESFPDDGQRKYWTHRLANLVLLSRQKNTKAQNYDFKRKKSEYFQKKGVVTFALMSQVLNEPEWTPTVLEHRQRYLISRFATEWRLC